MKVSKKDMDFLATSIREHGLSFIEYKDEEFSIKVGIMPTGSESSDFSKNEHKPQVVPNKVVEDKEVQVEENLKEVRIPIVGNIYFSKSPGEPQFVKVGDTIKKGDVIAIVEAMKVMNEVKAEHSGTITNICVEAGTFVDANTVIMTIK